MAARTQGHPPFRADHIGSLLRPPALRQAFRHYAANEIDDAELRGDNQGDRTLTIPCKSDPDLCMQLDAWDADTSIPAILDGEHSVLYREHYDQQSDAWVMRLA